MTRTRWGLLGAGWISRRAIAPAMHSAHGASLECVGARDAGRAEALSPRGHAYADYAAVIDDPNVDAIYIALSNDGHLPWAERALAAGKPVLCEKPLGRNAAEARRMRDAASASGTLLVEATWNLWHPRTARAAALLASDTIGRVVRVSGSFVFDGVDAGNYRLDPALGGGALLDIGCYPLTGAAWASGGNDIDVHDVDVVTGPTGVDLTTAADLTLGDVAVQVRASFIETAYESLVIEGDLGVIEFTGSDAYTSWQRPSALRVLDRDGERVEHFAPIDPYRRMIEHVSAAVRGEEAWLPDPQWSITVADAMDAIASRGHRP
jgi:D-xylose 1-dehydrogenase (NADP+, D-xylono-1,5-lactone-forming)